MSAERFLLDSTRQWPEKTALEFDRREISYRELCNEALRVASALRGLGAAPGDGVGLMLPNLPAFAATVFGSLFAGTRLVPMNVLLQPPEIRYVVEDSRLRVLVAAQAFLPQVEAALQGLPEPPTVVVVGRRGESGNHLDFDTFTSRGEPTFEPHALAPESPILTLYTSGTTGKPKGAMISNQNLISQLDMIDEIFATAEDDKYLCVLPLFHVFALNGILIAALKNGGTVVLHPRFEVADTVRSLANDGVTVFSGVPTMYFYILKFPGIEQQRFPALRHCFSGGAAMPVEVMRQFEKQFNVPIYEGYGLTETTVSVTCNRPDRPRKAGSIGLPYKGVEMKIVDDEGREVADGEIGEIVIRASNVMLGYLNKPQATAAAMRNGWFSSGDLGYRDEEGYFFIVDRKKDMILKGGYNIYPREIEEVLYERPEIAEAAVIGVPDEAKGETVRAVVAVKPGETLTEETLHRHLEERLARYKLPQDYVFLDELPKGPTGKILKRELRAEAQGQAQERQVESVASG